MMNGEALYENTQNSVTVVGGAITSTNGNTVHVTASGACMYGNNNMQPILDSIDEDTCTYSTLRPMEFNHYQLTPLNQRQLWSVVEDEYSCLQHNLKQAMHAHGMNYGSLFVQIHIGFESM